MLKNYLKIAVRNLWKNKFYSVLNILGLAMGMTVALLISLWLVDELSYNTYNHSYDRIALIKKNRAYNGQIFTETSNPVPLGKALRESYGNYFEEVVVSSYGGERTLTYGDRHVIRRGYFMEAGGQNILDLQIINGSVEFPLDASSLLLSESLSKSLFGDEDPIGKVISIDNNADARITGIYRDLPDNSTFRNVAFYGSFELSAQMHPWVRNSEEDWHSNAFPIYVKLAPQADFKEVSRIIQDITFNITKDESHPRLFLYPMSQWHLFPDFKNGKLVGTGLQNLWLFGLIGICTLILAAINFMNISTARSEKRSREIGIRKAVGSLRYQVARQFLFESALVVFAALIVALVAVFLIIPAFNMLTEKNLDIPWANPVFWLLIGAFGIFTAMLAGSYPSFYLSSFNPVKVLKGHAVSGRKSASLRKALVALQFGISVAMIIITSIVYQQIQTGKTRPVGYQNEGLVYTMKRSIHLEGKTDAVREQLLRSGAVTEVAESNGPVTDMWIMHSGFHWKGKDEGINEDFITLNVAPEFGETIDWNVIEGRDFSRNFSSDTSTMILNRAAVEFMGLEDPVGEVIRWNNNNFHVIGVVENLLMESPFESIRPTVFMMRLRNMPFVNMRLNPSLATKESVERIRKVFKEFNPDGEINLIFANEEHGLKFWREERMGKLSGIFSGIAIFISLLGIFGLSAFMAEQRTKEIGIKRVLGASIFSISRSMSNEFLRLVALSFPLAFPLAYAFVNSWLQKYEVRASIDPWIFLATGAGALVITMATVGFQSVKAALANPSKTLRTE